MITKTRSHTLASCLLLPSFTYNQEKPIKDELCELLIPYRKNNCVN